MEGLLIRQCRIFIGTRNPPPPPLLRTPKRLHGTMGFVGATSAGDFVFVLWQGVNFFVFTIRGISNMPKTRERFPCGAPCGAQFG